MHITFPGGSIWLCVRGNICLCACARVCVYDPLSDLEKQLHQSEDSWQLGNKLHSINNLPCASCMHNYRAEKQKHAA